MRLSEEKQETTFLDAIHLDRGGAIELPRSCSSASPRPAYCELDGVYFTLRQGESLNLEFVGSDESEFNVGSDLVATGYYVPLD